MALPALYMLPWLWALGARKSDAAAVGWMNLLLGWTVIGWLAALLWAARPHLPTSDDRWDDGL